MPSVECGIIDARGSSNPNSLIRHGPTLKVQVGFDPDHFSNPSSDTAPTLPSTEFHALIDTGATVSCIDSSTALSLQLPVVDRQKVAGVHGIEEVSVHLAQIYVPELQFVQVGKFAGVHLHAGGQPHSALIGRTFLRAFTMVYDGSTGSVIL